MAIPRGRDKRTALLGAVLVVAALVACVAVSLAVRPASARVVAHARFPITDLGTLPGGHRSYAYDINDRGQVVGYSETASGEDRAVLWQKGRIRSLGTLPGGDFSYASGINDRGQVVGVSEVRSRGPNHGGDFHAFLWEKGRMKDLGTPKRAGGVAFGDNSSASGINDRGQVVGGRVMASGEAHAFLWKCRRGTGQWRRGGMTDLGTLGGALGGASAINNRGQVVGSSYIGGRHYNPYHSFLWEKGRMKDLGTLAPQGPAHNQQSFATAINDREQVVGYSQTASDLYRAFVWKKGKMTALTLKGTPEETESKALDLNDRGQIVGKWTVYDSHEPHASLWQRGKRVDLGTLRGGIVSAALGINERGEVVGGSEVASGYTHAVLWGKRVTHQRRGSPPAVEN